MAKLMGLEPVTLQNYWNKVAGFEPILPTDFVLGSGNCNLIFFGIGVKTVKTC